MVENSGTQAFWGLLCFSSLYHLVMSSDTEEYHPKWGSWLFGHWSFLSCKSYHLTNWTICLPGWFWSLTLRNKSKCAKSLHIFLQEHFKNKCWENYPSGINSVSNPWQEPPDGGLVFLHQLCLSIIGSTLMWLTCFNGHRWFSGSVICGWFRLFPKILSVKTR